ncbi:MAG: hypothetical protein IID46_03460, partial [Planctomycetes bacterium]|nr:hypothetical protein [Planctomycetota bacterium]
SRGTQDQVYFAARLALADLVFHGAKPPLLLDDPFVKFDPQRRDAALELCKDINSEIDDPLSYEEAAEWSVVMGSLLLAVERCYELSRQRDQDETKPISELVSA